MTTFFLYLMKSVLCLALFYPFYMVLLSRETFHRFNRMALISILLASAVIPACRITTEEPMLLSQLYQRWEHWLTGQEADPATAAAEVDWADMEFAAIPIVDDMPEVAPAFSLGDFLSEHWGDLLFLLYIAGILFLIGRHIASLVRLFALLRQGQMQRLDDGNWLYLHPQSDIAPFSWMKYIVISEADYRENGRQIVAHEQAHISNRHSWDLLLVEICLLAQWFNPAAWLLRQELQNIHEYEADDTVLRRGINAKEYQLLIIKKAVGARLYSLANSLNHSSLKKRLTMMMKEKSHPWARLKYLYVLPLAAISLVAFAHTEAANNSNGISEAKVKEVPANEQTSNVKSSENDAILAENPSPGWSSLSKTTNAGEKKILIIVDGKLTIQEAEPIDWTNEDLAKHIGVTPEEIAQIEVIKKPEVLAQWHIPEATGAILVTTKKARVDHLKLNGTPHLNEKESYIEVDNAEEVFMVVEKMPEFPGGNAELMKFFTTNLKYPIEAQQQGVQGRVIVQFVVGKEGKLRDFEIKKGVSPDLDAEAIRVCQAMPNWKPGTQRGEAVSVKYTVPISFRLESGKQEHTAACIVRVNNKGGYMYGPFMKEGSLEEVLNYVNDQRKESDSAGKGNYFKVQLIADKDAPQESVDKLKEALREIYVLQINYKKLDADEVFQVVEKMPEFPGGNAELMNYLRENIRYPQKAMEDSIQGRVIVQFVVTKTGAISNATIIRGVSPELDAEALRVINAMPAWTPGEQRGQAVNVKFTLPIQFRLQSGKTKEQTIEKNINGETIKIHTSLTHKPQYPGGQAKLENFIKNSMKYDKTLSSKPLEYVVLAALISKEGKLLHIYDQSALNPSSTQIPELKTEAMRIAKTLPQEGWQPALFNGQPVNALFPIFFSFPFGKLRNSDIQLTNI